LGEAIFAALTFHINWLEIKTGYLPGPWDVLWSLSIEEVFYFFFPLVWFLIRKEWHFVFLVVAFLVISPFARTTWFHEYNPDLADKNHFAYLDAISLGCLAAIISRRVCLKRNHLTVLAVLGWSLMSLVLFFRSISGELNLGQTGLNVTVLSLGTAMVLIWMQKRTESGRQRTCKWGGVLRIFGRNSYEIYLTHLFVVYALFEVYKRHQFSGEWTWVLYIATILLSGLLGEIVARYISNPANSYLRKQFNTKK
jgi:peptidoglycan/LPS O-acetylase OafA/YrhL